MQAGDLVMAFGSADDSAFDRQWQPETNWNYIRVYSIQGNAALYYRYADAGFVSSPTVTFDLSGTADSTALIGMILSGVHQTCPISGFNYTQDVHFGQDPAPSPDQLFGMANGAWVVGALYTGGSLPASGWAPSGYTERAVNNSQTNAMVAVATKALSGTPPISEVPGGWDISAADIMSTIFAVILPDTATFGGGGGGYPVIGKGLIR
jgi:hypothetical protein